MSRAITLLGPLFLIACIPSAPTHVSDAGQTTDAGLADGGPETGLPTQPSLEQLAAWWDANVSCRLYSCEQRVRETPETCALAREADGVPYDSFRRALASVAAGRATFDPVAGRNCAAFLKGIDLTRECFGQGVISFRDSYGPGFVANCSGLVTGKVAYGATCTDNAECLTGADCVFNRTSDCSGQCVLWLGAGESCSERQADCSRENYCDGTICKSRGLLADGQTCYDSGESCQSGKCFEYQCKTINGNGGECVAEGDCGLGLFCRPLPPSTGQLGVCQTPAAAGAMCGYTVRCVGNQSCAGYFWANRGGWTQGTCSDRPKAIGETCVPVTEGYDYGDSGCFMDLACDPATTKCVEAPALGSACSMPGSRCGYSAYCDTAGICRARKAAGEAAESKVECRNEWDSYEKKCYRQADLDRCGLR